MVNLYISEYVIDEVCQSVGRFGSHHSDAANKRAVHCSLYESEDVPNAASCQVFTHRLAIYGRFLYDSVWFLLQRYYLLSKYQNKHLIISKLVYRTSLYRFLQILPGVIDWKKHAYYRILIFLCFISWMLFC